MALRAFPRGWLKVLQFISDSFPKCLREVIVSDHYHDYMQEQAFDEFYSEIKEQAILEFTGERLKSYYVANRFLAKPAVNALAEARAIMATNETASLIFSVIAIEVGIKTTLLKPIVYGHVHTHSIAALIADLIISRRREDFKELLILIIKKHGGVDLTNYKRKKSCQNIVGRNRGSSETEKRGGASS